MRAPVCYPAARADGSVRTVAGGRRDVAPEKERKREARDGGRHVCFFQFYIVY